MASSYGAKTVFTKESEVWRLLGFIAVKSDGSGDVLPSAPNTSPGSILPVSFPWSRFKGAEKSLSVVDGYGNLVVQPHTGTGTYTITLDEGWVCLVGTSVTCDLDGYGTTAIVTANVTNTQDTTSLLNNFLPGTNSSITPRTVIVTFVNSSNVPTEPHGSFWISLDLKKNNVSS